MWSFATCAKSHLAQAVEKRRYASYVRAQLVSVWQKDVFESRKLLQISTSVQMVEDQDAGFKVTAKKIKIFNQKQKGLCYTQIKFTKKELSASAQYPQVTLEREYIRAH